MFTFYRSVSVPYCFDHYKVLMQLQTFYIVILAVKWTVSSRSTGREIQCYF